VVARTKIISQYKHILESKLTQPVLHHHASTRLQEGADGVESNTRQYNGNEGSSKTKDSISTSFYNAINKFLAHSNHSDCTTGKEDMAYDCTCHHCGNIPYMSYKPFYIVHFVIVLQQSSAASLSGRQPRW
jgi:hypothetical protein